MPVALLGAYITFSWNILFVAAMLAIVGEFDLPGFDVGVVGLRQAEVEDLHLALARQHHVAGFQIPMNDAYFVRSLQRLPNTVDDNRWP